VGTMRRERESSGKGGGSACEVLAMDVDEDSPSSSGGSSCVCLCQPRTISPARVLNATGINPSGPMFRRQRWQAILRGGGG